MSPLPDCEKLPDEDPPRELVQRVEGILARGGLVAMPTETVYGVAARADLPSALDALRSWKGRPKDMALTWHVGSLAALEQEGHLTPRVRRLVDRYWPGPLTLVLPGVPRGLEPISRDGWIGVRFPAHRATADIIARLPFPVVMSSANRHGVPPATTAMAVSRFDSTDGPDPMQAPAAGDGTEFDLHSGPCLELLLDGGPARLAESSCVLQIGDGHFKVLREGLIGIEQLRAAAGLRLGFACTGNTCRSPMAEAWARKRIAEELKIAEVRLSEFGFAVESMGVQASHGQPASKLSIQVMRELGVDLARHRSRAAMSNDLPSFDRLYGLTRAHVDSLVLALPPGRMHRVELLDPSGADIPDPIGGTRDDYANALRRIREGVEARVREWV
jgi:protein-tyrosine phosphatase